LLYRVYPGPDVRLESLAAIPALFSHCRLFHSVHDSLPIQFGLLSHWLIHRYARMEAVLLKRLLAGLLGAWQALSAVRLGYVTAAIASA